MMVTDQQIEEILLLAYLTEMTLVQAAYAVIPGFDQLDHEATTILTIRLGAMRKKLDTQFKKAHS